MQVLENEEVMKWKENSDDSKLSAAPQLVVQHFFMEALHLAMLNNGNKMLGMFDEMSVMYSQLDAYKHSESKLDRSTLLQLYTGGSWSRTFKNKDMNTSKMTETSFNMCGFIQPSFVVSMLEENDPEAFNDRQFFVCPQEVDFKYEELRVPMDAGVPELSNIFRTIKKAHENRVTYTMSIEAKRKFVDVHDDLRARKIEIKMMKTGEVFLVKPRGK